MRTNPAIRRAGLAAAALVLLGLQAALVVLGLHFVPGVRLPSDPPDLVFVGVGLIPPGIISAAILVPLALLGGMAISDSDDDLLTAIQVTAFVLVLVTGINALVFAPYSAILEQFGLLAIGPPYLNDSDTLTFVAIGTLETVTWAVPMAFFFR